MNYFRAKWLRTVPDLEVQKEIFRLLKETSEEDNEKRVAELVNTLAKKRQSVDFLDQYSGQTPLHLAADRGLARTIKSLVSAHANLERKDIMGRSAMHYAVMEGHRDTVECLRNLGASIQTSWKGRPALHLAFYYGRHEVAEYLLDLGMKLDGEDERCRTPIASASYDGKMSENWIMEKMQNHISLSGSEGSEFLVCAAEAGLSNIVTYLIEKRGINVNTCRKNGQTALMAACQRHHTHEEHYKHIVTLLLEKSIDVNVQDAEGNTALHFASKNNVPQLVKLLLTSGANADLFNQEKETPLDLARKFDCEDTEKTLVRYRTRGAKSWRAASGRRLIMSRAFN